MKLFAFITYLCIVIAAICFLAPYLSTALFKTLAIIIAGNIIIGAIGDLINYIDKN